ncbi:hypothetical protein pb186bvf_017293 [Paramecium bursaria]
MIQDYRKRSLSQMNLQDKCSTESPIKPDQHIQLFQNEKINLDQVDDYIENEQKKTLNIFLMSFRGIQSKDPLQIYQDYLCGNNPIKQGYIMFRVESSSFSNVFLNVTREKIIIVNKQQTSLFRFKVYKVQNIKQNQFKDFKIIIDYAKIRGENFPSDITKTLYFKAKDNIEGRIWFQTIKILYDNFEFDEKITCDIQYFQENTILEKTFLNSVETGDILLFETKNILAKFQRVLTSSEFDHVAIAIRVNNKVQVFEANSDDGVILWKWDEFIRVFIGYKRICFRKLMNVNRGKIQEQIQKFAESVQGQQYNINIRKLMQEKTNFLDKGFFCSELVAKAYKTCDLLTDNKPSSSYWPITFSKNLRLKSPSYLDDIHTIILNKDII